MKLVVSYRKKLPAFFSIFWTIIWCVAGCILITAAFSRSRYEEIWIAGVALILFGALTARSYLKKAPSLQIVDGSTLILNNDVYTASDITSVRHESESRWNWVRTWNVFAVILFILAIVLIIASICGDGVGGDFAGIGDIFMPNRPAKTNEVMVLRFKDGSTRRIFSTMYHNYHQLRDAVHTLTWSIRPRI